MVRKFFFVCAGLLCLVANPILAQVPVATVLAEDGASYPHALVVMDNGDVYRSDFGPRTTASYPQLPWYFACNILSAGGPGGRVVGIGEGYVLTDAGGVYRLGIQAGQPCYGIFDGVIDHPAEQVFVAFGSNIAINGCFIYAVTNTADVYRTAIGCGYGGWEHVGALPVGPTSTRRETWGGLKVLYR